MDPKDVKLFIDLGLAVGGTMLLGLALLMLVKKKGGAALATLTLIIGLTLVQNWGTPDLLEQLINFGVKILG